MSLSASQILADHVLSWPGVSQQPHRFGGIEFVYNGKEIGHVHGDHLVDLPFSKSQRDRIVAEGKARPHHIFPDSGWVSVYITSHKDVDNAIALLRVKYEDLRAKIGSNEE
ncbi:luciferase family protein [Brevibacillus sp. B_LB10_24]|uniref:luciferase domain-containing protein n=1 Tax=Brevibacillus sp. B_LB10_24 TaxID=3380645 RepID=UPI0038BD19AC